jgi:serine/threonine protein kinase
LTSWYETSGGDQQYAGPPSSSDRYALEEVVSQGMEGRLWRASLMVDGHRFQVAVKEIHQRNVASLDEWIQRWERQAELLRSLDHPGLVRVRELFQGAPPHPRGAAGDHERSLYLVMNWASGRPLDEWAQDEDLRAHLDVLGQVAAAVDHLHSGSDTNHVAVLHRDIKPQNIIIDAEGRPRLVDFGFARLADSRDYTVVGSANYMAPEIPLGSVPTPASDRYSFGCVAYTVLSGRRVDPADPAGVDATIDALVGAGLRPDLGVHLRRLLSPRITDRPTDLKPWRSGPQGDPGGSDAAVGRGSSTVVRPSDWRPPTTVDAAAPPTAPLPTQPVAPVPLTASGQPATYPPSAPGSWPPPRVTSFEPASPSVGPLPLGSPTLSPDAFDPPSNRHWSVGLAIGLAVAAVLTLAVAGGVWLVGNRDAQAGPSTTASPTTASTTATTVLTAVPDLVGSGRSDAEAALARRGLVARSQYLEDPAPAETVLRVEPSAGTGLPPGGEVRLTVSSPTFTMPDLRGRTVGSARDELDARGHLPGYVRVDPTGVASDVVVTDQSPPVGASQPKAGTVVLIARVPVATTTSTTIPDTEGRLPTPTSPP